LAKIVTISSPFASQLSVEQVAGAINGMIAERAAERLREPPAIEAPATLKPHAPGMVFGMRPRSTTAIPRSDRLT
jgi:hypothetical protein